MNNVVKQQPQVTQSEITEALKMVYKQLKANGHSDGMIRMFVMQELKQISRGWK